MAPERHSLNRRQAVLTPLLLASAVGLLGACGSSSHSTSSRTAAPASAAAQITRNWTTFFKGSTPTSTRVSLLQNGQRFRQALSAQSSSPLAQQASARVRSVSVTGPATATVHYDVLLAGKTALPGQTGTAVRHGGTWQVADSSFCALLRLEGAAPPACPKG